MICKAKDQRRVHGILLNQQFLIKQNQLRILCESAEISSETERILHLVGLIKKVNSFHINSATASVS